MKKIICLFTVVLSLSGCIKNGCVNEKYMQKGPDVILTLEFSNDKAIPSISIDGPIKRGRHELSKYNQTLFKQKFIDNAEYLCLSMGGGLNSDYNFNVLLLDFSVSEINKDRGARVLILDTKVSCKIEIQPNDSSVFLPNNGLFEPGKYSFELRR